MAAMNPDEIISILKEEIKNYDEISKDRRAIIPIKMMNDIPLPIPLSVILSPSHRINILPAAKMMVEVIIKN